MDTWIIAAYLLISLALGLFVGAGIGYYAAAREMSMPRYRRVGRPVAPLGYRVTTANGLTLDTPSRAAAETFASRHGGAVVGRPE